MRKMLGNVVACSQMSNPQAGTGSGGDRCTEACVSMVDCTYRLGPKAQTIGQPGVDPNAVAERIMYDLTEMLNAGSDVSVPENLGVWLPAWLSQNGYDKIISLANVHNPSWSDIVRDIDAGHIAIIGVNDYSQLHTFAGGDPYAWPENAANSGGHVLLLVGYDDNFNGTGEQTVIVNDPLRALSGMPYDYSFSSLQAAGFSDLTEIVGTPLPGSGLSSTALCVDVSSWQGNIDWPTYHVWSQKMSADGRSHAIMRASQDVATRDADFDQNYAGAVAAGVDHIVVYHYAYPQNDSPQAEAAWFAGVVGSRLRPQDEYMLDFEENNSSATDAWVLAFRDEMMKLTGREILVYMNLNMIQNLMHNPALSSIPLVLADWTFDPNARPACPAPFTQMKFIQYTDKGSVPGIQGLVDMDVFLGGPHMNVPSGWSDDGTSLTAPNGFKVTGPFRAYILNNGWDPADYPVQAEEHLSSLELANPALGPGSQQVFRYHVLEWEDAQKVTKGLIQAWVGPEIVALRQALAAVPVDINLLRDQLAQAEKDASDAKAADAKAQADLAQSEKDRQDEGRHYLQQITLLNKDVSDRDARLSSLNSELIVKDGQLAGEQRQLAAEQVQISDLQRQVADLKKAQGRPAPDGLKEELQDLADSLVHFPELKRVIDGFVSKL